MLTRNLYELDEVVAALQLCLRTVNQQAYFWAWELYISEENLRVLQESWLAHGAPHDPKIFKNLISLFQDCKKAKLIIIHLNEQRLFVVTKSKN